MKNKVIILLVLLIGVQFQLSAARRRGDYFSRPQVGILFGPYTPLFEVGDELDTTIGFGGFTRINVPRTPMKVGFDIGYQQHGSMNNNELQAMPMYGSLQYRLPLETPLNMLVKGGLGAAHLWLEPDKISRWDPLGMAGFEVSFPVGRLVNIGLRLDYMLMYEKHLDNAELNGNFFNAAICVFFNL